jgi:hypothetical protein
MIKLFDKENDEGNIEYKLIINKKKTTKLITQFFFRLREGNGKCIYIIGIDDNGFLHFTNIKYILLNTLFFIKLIKIYAHFKVKLFIYNKYIYSIICFYNYNINYLLEFNLL